MSVQRIARLVLLLLAIVLLPRVARAQVSAGSIAGVVKDTSGAVVPGVTVEAASPALIEKIRSVVTDGQGQYKIVDLRPGTYTVTFTLAGFNTFKREGIELTTGVTATANADLRVGELTETVTVTGASPVVDTQNVRSQTLLSRQVLDALPTNRTIQGFAALTVGASLTGAVSQGNSMQDVGGNKGEQYGTIMVHGSRTTDGKLRFDGMQFNNMLGTGAGQSRFWVVNQAAVSEVAVETSGMSAESSTGGVYQNSVPKDGGNLFSVYFSTNGTNGDLQGDNLTDELRARGLTTVSKVKQIFDVGVGVGGPIRRDKLWFYTAHRTWNSQEYAAGIFYNKTQGAPLYTADLDRQGFTDYPHRDHSLRLTWQAAPKHKITLFDSVQSNCQCNFGVGVGIFAPESVTDYYLVPNYLAMATWSYPASNRLLFEAGGAYLHNRLAGRQQPEVSPSHISTLELSRNFRYNAVASGVATTSIVEGLGVDLTQNNERFSMSYITGSHAFKAGLFTLSGVQNVPRVVVNQDLNYNFRNGLPVQLVQWASPGHSEQSFRELGIYAQDQWTVRKVTLNLGVRFDQVKGRVPAQERPAGQFVPALRVDPIDNVPNLMDLSPRLGVAYDLFGNGKTAIKASLGRYLGAVGPNVAFAVNPANALVASSTRTWTDSNGNFIPDCNLQSREENAECGALDNRRFGTVSPSLRYSKDVLEGFGNREFNWQTSVSVQHELRPGVGVNVGYYRTWFGNFLVTDNLSVTPADFDPYCITAPVDARLPGGGGYQICDGLGDVKPAKFGLVDNLVTFASNFGNQKEIYNGVDATFNARFGDGGLLQGGMNVGRKMTECVIVDGPLQFCKNEPPFRPEFKFSGVYPLPFWGLQTSVTFQNLPGTPIGGGVSGTAVGAGADIVATSAQIKPSLGRDLAAGPRGVAIVNLFEPNTLFEARITQVDLRFTKILRVGRGRVRGMFDIYNLFNANTILADITRFGPAYLRPTSVLGARLFKFGAQLDF